MNHDVFISYSSYEKNYAYQTKEVIESNGHTCWLAPDSIPPGSSYATEIDKALSACKVVVVILSEKAQESIWVPKEISRALGYKKTIIPFHIDESDLRDAFCFYLTDAERIEAYQNLTNGYSQLVLALNRIIGSKNDTTQTHEQKPEHNAIHSMLKSKYLKRRSDPDSMIGKHLFFGSYPQGVNGVDNTPIEWLILDQNENKALVISKYTLDVLPYHSSFVDVTWEFCSLRDWLNYVFYSKAFSKQEQAAILLSNVDNSVYQGCKDWKSQCGNNTQDKVFVLSYTEAQTYLLSNEEKGGIATEYALKQATSNPSKYVIHEDEIGTWWLRSPGSYQDHACVFGTDKTIGCWAVEVSYGGVRPALWIDLKSLPS